MDDPLEADLNPRRERAPPSSPPHCQCLNEATTGPRGMPVRDDPAGTAGMLVVPVPARGVIWVRGPCVRAARRSA
jgi:hypothetical protein